MRKDFDSWNISKKRINAENVNRFYHEREVWWIVLGANIGTEEDGKGALFERPALVVKSFSQQECIIVPLTTSPGMMPFSLRVGEVDGQESFAIISQVRAIDTKRLLNKVGYLNAGAYESVKMALKECL